MVDPPPPAAAPAPGTAGPGAPGPIVVRVPGSSANLGPGFDALGLALAVTLDVSCGDDAQPVEPSHPAARAFVASGGQGGVAVRGRIPPGRGMGFSGAARVGGAMAAFVQQGCDEDVARERAWRLAAELEGHPDNAAASALGGLTVAVGTTALRVPIAVELAVVVWIPDETTSTKASRTQLPLQVPFADAVFNVGRSALLVAALTTGRIDALAEATRDRLHQDARLARVPAAAEAIAAARAAGAWAAWLSGSGPSVAALVAPGVHATRVADALAGSGRTIVTGVDFSGARRVDVERPFGPIRGAFS